MRTSLYVLFLSISLLIISTTASGAWTVVSDDGFETGFGNYVSAGNDCKHYTNGDEGNGDEYASQGTHAVNIQGKDDLNGYFSYSSTKDWGIYTEIRIEFDFVAVSMDSSSEGFRVELDYGTGWETVASYYRDTDFDNNVPDSKTITVLASTKAFTSTMNLRFICDASGGGDDVFIDEVVVSGESTDTAAPTPNPAEFLTAPTALDETSVTMTAKTGTDSTGPVEYLFTETTGNPGATSSSWQTNSTYVDSGLSPATLYTYTVTMRDSVSPAPNVGTVSPPANITTNTTAPNVTGQFRTDANSDIAAAGLFTGTITEVYNESVNAGHVISQSPSGGTSVATGTLVDLEISLGTRMLDLEDIMELARYWLDFCGNCGHANRVLDTVIDIQDFVPIAEQWLVPPPAPPVTVVINEVIADNTAYWPDEVGEYEDWIELYNYGAEEIDLSGMYLNDGTGPGGWTIANGTSLAAGDYIVFWADDEVDEGPLHTNFKLGAGGETVSLYEADGVTLVDQKIYPSISEDVSYGRYTDGTDDWYTMAAPSPDATNTAAQSGEVHFSRLGGTFTSNFDLTLATEGAAHEIRYTTDGTIPTAGSMLYSGPITIDNAQTRRIWARTFDTTGTLAPGPVGYHSYIPLSTDMHNFKSNLPIVIVDTFGASITTGNRRMAVEPVVSTFIDTDDTGIARAADIADYSGRAGMKVRGRTSSTWPKKPFSFETWSEVDDDDLAVSLLGMPADSDWMFFNVYRDKSLIRNTLTYKWSNDIGLYAIRTIPVELFMNEDNNQVSYTSNGISSITYTTPALGAVAGDGQAFVSMPIDAGDLVDGDNVFAVEVHQNHPGSSDISFDLELTANTGTLVSQGATWKYLDDGSDQGTLWWAPAFDDNGWASGPAELGYGETEATTVSYGPDSNNKYITTYFRHTFNIPDASAVTSLDLQVKFDDGIVVYLNGQEVGRDNMPSDAGAGDIGADYRGVYVFAEKIRIDKKRVDIPHLEPVDNTEPEVTGGYIIKIDKFESSDDGYAEGDGRWTTAANMLAAFQYQEPSYYDISGGQKSWLLTWLNEFESVLQSGSFADPVNGYAKYANVEACIEYDLMTEIFKNVDGYRLSMYYNKDRDKILPDGTTITGQMSIGPLFDHNFTAGNNFCYNSDTHLLASTQGWFRDNSGTAGSDWTDRMMDDPEFNIKHVDKWFEHRENKLSDEQVDADVEYYGTLLNTILPGETTSAADRNFTKWTNLSTDETCNYLQGITTVTSHEMEIQWLKHWLTGGGDTNIIPDVNDFSDRFGWIDEHFGTDKNQYAPPVIKINGVVMNSGGHANSGDLLTMESPDGLIEYTINGADPREIGGSINPNASTYSSALILTRSTRIRARVKNGSNWGALNKATFSVGPVGDNLRITEVMYHPADPNEEFIEFKNVGASSIDLDWVRLTNGVDFTFTFPPGTTLAPDAYMVVVEDEDQFKLQHPTVPDAAIAGQYEGALSNSGEEITFRDAADYKIQDFDYADGWYPVTDGKGFSLCIVDEDSADPNDWDSKSGWYASSDPNGSPAAVNPAPVQPNGSVVINEILSHTDGADGDWIELHNTTGSPINIGNWYLSDNSDNLTKYKIAPGTTIPANGHISFTAAANFNNAGDSGSSVQFAFSEHGEEAYLSSGSGSALAGGYSIKQTFGAAESEVSFGRHVKSALAGYEEDFVAQSSNTKDSVNAGPQIPDVVINEIMYNISNAHDELYEFIELKNTGGSTVNLYDSANPGNTWMFTKGIKFTFPAGISLASGERLVISRTVPAVFKANNSVPSGVQVLGPFELDSELDDGGEKIELSRPGNPELDGFVPYIRVEQVNYSDGDILGIDPWPISADGSGDSLNRTSATVYSNDVANWHAAAPTPGDSNNAP